MSSCIARLSSREDKSSCSSELVEGGIRKAILGHPKPTKAALSFENSEAGIRMGRLTEASWFTGSDCSLLVSTAVLVKNSLVEQREWALLWSAEVSQASISRRPLIVAGSTTSVLTTKKPWTTRTWPRRFSGILSARPPQGPPRTRKRHFPRSPGGSVSRLPQLSRLQ